MSPPWATAMEAAGLLATGVVAAIGVLGVASNRLAGPGLWANLVPFAAVVVALGLALAACLRVWRWSRLRLLGYGRLLPLALALLAVVLAGAAVQQPEFATAVSDLRAVLGGRAEAERRTIAHQVYAAYRRTPPASMRELLEHAKSYEGAVLEAAEAFGVDPEVLMGVAAAESGFRPRDSHDGGRGLFQITAPPAAAQAEAASKLGAPPADLADPRQNAFVAAATLRRYLDQMEGDLFLALLAYNIGPRNGGLRTIMDQYGARDFVAIQPYLQNLPRDYPIRVLAGALAYRVSRREGVILRYEKGRNASRIQALGVPGL